VVDQQKSNKPNDQAGGLPLLVNLCEPSLLLLAKYCAMVQLHLLVSLGLEFLCEPGVLLLCSNVQQRMKLNLLGAKISRFFARCPA